MPLTRLQACNKSSQMLSSVLEANKMKKNASVLKTTLAAELVGIFSLFICFSASFDDFLPGTLFICCEFIQLAEVEFGTTHLQRALKDAMRQTETFLGEVQEVQECCAFLKLKYLLLFFPVYALCRVTIFSFYLCEDLNCELF